MKHVNPFEIVPKAPELAKADAEFLAEREKTISSGLKKFLEVGTALLEIQNYKNGVLFKQGFGSFENYCRERWGFGQSQAYRLMGDAKIVSAISPMGEKENIPMPIAERQIRPLALLKKPADQFKAWKAVAAEHKPEDITGKLVNAAVKEQIANGALRASKERKPVGKNAEAKPAGKEKPPAEIRKVIAGKLCEIQQEAGGNKTITKLVSEIEALLLSL